MSREWAIDIDGVPFIELQTGMRQFRVAFNVVIRPGDSTATAMIELYNLSPKTIIERGKSIVLQAGYTESVDVIFSGYITNMMFEREGPNIKTVLLCRSGDATTRGSAGASYPKDTKVIDVLIDLARQVPARLDIDTSQFDSAHVLTSGFVANGDIIQILDELSYSYDFEYIYSNGTISINRENKQRTVAGKIKIDQLSGMEGIPEVNRGPEGVGVFVRTRLNPAIRPYGSVEIESRFATYSTGNMYFVQQDDNLDASGDYQILDITHKGDSHGDVWTSEINCLRPGILLEPASAVQPTATNGALVWGARVDQPFRDKTRQISENLKLDPNWLMAIINVETGGSFSPAQPNLDGGGAMGLIQFIPDTAKALGTSRAQLSRMTAVQQLDYVEKYFKPYASRIKSLGDAYMAVLWPAGIGQPDTYVMWRKDSGPDQRAYAQNSSLDRDHKGYITKADATNRVNNSYAKGLKHAQ